MAIVKCQTCSKEFYAKPSHIKLGYCKYCSRKCQAESQKTGKFVLCDTCGKEIWRNQHDLKFSKSKKYFCNKSCQTFWRNKFYSGFRHPNWKNGEHQEYRSFLIRSGVKRICLRCQNKDERILVVHHLDKDRANNKVSNLVWLCLNCHYLIHNYNEDLYGGRSSIG